MHFQDLNFIKITTLDQITQSRDSRTTKDPWKQIHFLHLHTLTQMSTPLEPQQQPPPPPLEVTQQAYTSQPGHGSIGPVIGVLAVITILGAIAVMIGRLCSGRRIMGHGQYDFEGWVEAKCGSCIDGRVDPPTPPRRPPPPPRQPHSGRVESGSSSGRVSSGVPDAGPTQSGQEAREEEVTRPEPGGSASAGSWNWVGYAFLDPIFRKNYSVLLTPTIW